ncbi:MAG: hypothetical protein AAGD34_21870 [Pseudomonadota bacterium]
MYEVQYIAPVDCKRGTAELAFPWKGGELAFLIHHERHAFSYDVSHQIIRFRRWRDLVCESGPEQPLVQLKERLEKDGVEALWLEGKGGPGTYSAKTPDIDVGEIFRAFDEVTAHLTEWEMDMRARGVAEY